MRWLTVCLSLATLLACGQGAPSSSSSSSTGPGSTNTGANPALSNKSKLLGTWQSPWNRSSGTRNGDTFWVEFQVRMTFDSNRLASKAFCRDSTGRALTAEVSSSAEITETTIRTFESADRAVRDDDFSCNATIRAGSMEYRISGNELRFSDATGSESAPLTKTSL